MTYCALPVWAAVRLELEFINLDVRSSSLGRLEEVDRIVGGCLGTWCLRGICVSFLGQLNRGRFLAFGDRSSSLGMARGSGTRCGLCLAGGRHERIKLLLDAALGFIRVVRALTQSRADLAWERTRHVTSSLGWSKGTHIAARRCQNAWACCR